MVVQQEEKVGQGQKGKTPSNDRGRISIPGWRFRGAQFPPCDESGKNGMNLGENEAEKEPGEWEGKQPKRCDQEAFY